VLSALRQSQGEDRGAEDRTFLVTGVVHAGLNNLPKGLSQALGERFGAQGADLLEPWVEAELRAQAAKTGYANRFEAIRSHVPWRPILADGTGARPHPRATVEGALSATVVGPGGQTEASGAEEIHTDRLGRIRIRYDIQGLDGSAMGPDTSYRLEDPVNAKNAVGGEFIDSFSGGGIRCCFELPRRWHAGIKVRIQTTLFELPPPPNRPTTAPTT